MIRSQVFQSARTVAVLLAAWAVTALPALADTRYWAPNSGTSWNANWTTTASSWSTCRRRRLASSSAAPVLPPPHAWGLLEKDLFQCMQERNFEGFTVNTVKSFVK